MLKTRRTSAEPRIEMAPIIDVVFLLLTFFVFSLLLLSRVSVVDLDLPAMGSGEPRQGPQAVVVAVDSQGMVFVDGQPVGPASARGQPLAETTRTALIDAIQLSAGPGATPADQSATKPTIRLEVDERGVSGALLRVLDVLRTQGYEAIELVGSPAEPEATTPATPAQGDP
ncbi:hypothetical protein AY599_08130 [Leptolyngbya valderiana BDU 20041]|nr:hypothetical protein AY599_08130 [Leptolyngbya valderiana BDU 20041]